MHVIFLAPHFPAGQRRFVQGLKNVGARVTGIGDARPEAMDSGLASLLDGYEYVRNVTDEDEVFRAVRRIQDRGPWVHRFEATIEAHMYTAARVRERTAIPGLSYETVDRCRDKFLMKAYLAERGIPCAAHAVVDTALDLVAFVERVGFPVILKPRDGAGAHSTYKLEDEGQLARALAETGLDRHKKSFVAEEFITGHEGFWDTLTVGGRVVFEAVSHYYPNVLPAMRDPEHPAMIVTTNRVETEGYQELRVLGRKVLAAMGIDTSPTHMEWFFGPKGLRFSEIGARPPGVNFWDVYCAANEIDLYTEWARGVCYGDVQQAPSRRYSAGLLSIRPTAQGTVQGYAGVDEVQARFGEFIEKSHLPPRGARTQSHEAGYLANAWMIVKHPDYDACKGIMEEIGRTIRMIAG